METNGKFHQRVLLYIAVSVSFAIAIALGMWSSSSFILGQTSWSFLGSKLTLLAILLAAGVFQYNQFHNTYQKIHSERIPEWDSWNRLQSTTDMLDEISTSPGTMRTIPIDRILETIAKNRLNLKMEKGHRPADIQRIKDDLNQFSAGLALQFSISSCLLLSIWADVILLRFVEGRFWTALSLGGFIVGLSAFTIMGVLYCRIVYGQFRSLQEVINKYKTISSS